MYKLIIQVVKMILFTTLISFGTYSGASVVISGTRVIYLEEEGEVTVLLTNEGASSVLVQSWLDNGDIDAMPDNINIPFILSPPIIRIDPEKNQKLRMSYSGKTLPSDRESLFWLNVLEIPQTKIDAPKNRLQVAFRSRIKFFYRPIGLKGDAIEAARSLSWSIKDGHLSVYNHSAFYVSLISITVLHSGKKTVIDGDIVEPFNSKDFPVKSGMLSTHDSLTYEYINDWGAVVVQDVLL
ncbi:fimbria/pilus periplasmic chaperone [Providencia rettgeri]